MPDHLTGEQLAGYRRRTLPPAELLAADAHLMACAACRAGLDQVDPSDGTLLLLRANLQAAAAPEPAHLSYEQMEPYVDGTLDARNRAAVEEHVAGCSSCASDLESLRAFAQMAAEPRVGPPAPSRGKGFLAFWRLPTDWTRMQWVGAAAMAVLLVTVSAVGLFVWKSREAGGPPDGRWAQSARTAPSPGSTVPPAPSSPQATAPAQPDSSPATVLSLHIGGGKTLTLDRQGQVGGVEDYPAPLRQMIQTAVATQRVLTSPALRSLIERVRVRGDADSAPPFHLLSPVGTVVETDTPTFRWQSWPGATGYTVAVFDSRQEEVARSPRGSGTKWVAARPLARGGTYTWQVTAVKDGEEHTVSIASGRTAKFKVLERAKVDELARARAHYPDSPLVLGILYAQEGLLDDAQSQLEALAEANRNASPAARQLAQKWLADLQALRATPSR